MVDESKEGPEPRLPPGAEPPAGLGPPVSAEPPVGTGAPGSAGTSASPAPPVLPVPPAGRDSGRGLLVGILVVVVGLLAALGVVAWKAGWLDGLSPFRQSSTPIETSIEPTASSGDLLPAETFRWRYDNQDFELTMQVPEGLYLYYKGMQRAPVEDYSIYVSHSRDDVPVTGPLAARLQELASARRYDARETVNFTASFVQTLRYREETGEYPNYPVETLVDRAGDCEDTAILAAALLDAMGYDAVLIRFTSPVEGEAGHMAVGVAVPGVSGGYSYRLEGETYYYLETTSTWELGEIPPDVLSKFNGTTDGIYALAPAPALRFSGSLEYSVESRWFSDPRVSLSVTVTNWGTAGATDFYLRAYFEGHQDGARLSPTYDLLPGYRISNVAVADIVMPSGAATLRIDLWQGGRVVDNWTTDLS